MTSREKRRGGDLRQLIVKKILSSRVSTPSIKEPRQIRRFLQQYFADVPVDDLQGRSESVMARVALDHLEFGAKRRTGLALVRIYNPTEKEHGYASAFTFIEMVNDDMPILVDSVASAINRHEMVVHITVHPIVAVKRDSTG